MSRPNLGYSNYYWIRQDQKAAQKKQSELSSELNTELNTRDQSPESHETLQTLQTPVTAAEDGVKTQDFWNKHDEIRDAHAASHNIEGANRASSVENSKDSCELNHEKGDSNHAPPQDSGSFASLVRDGEVKSNQSPSAPLPRIDSWLPAVVPESDK